MPLYFIITHKSYGKLKNLQTCDIHKVPSKGSPVEIIVTRRTALKFNQLTRHPPSLNPVSQRESVTSLFVGQQTSSAFSRLSSSRWSYLKLIWQIYIKSSAAFFPLRPDFPTRCAGKVRGRFACLRPNEPGYFHKETHCQSADTRRLVGTHYTPQVKRDGLGRV